MPNLLQKASIITTPTAYDNGSLHSVKPVQTFGSEIADNNTLYSRDGGVVIKTASLTYNATSDGTSSSGARPKITFDDVVAGRSYTLEIIPSNQSGTINADLYNGSSYEFQNNTLSDTVIYNFVCGASGSSQLFFDGTLVFNVDFTISLKEVTEADFDFTRGSSATRVNEQGLIEDVQILSGELVQNGDFEQIGSELVTNGDFATDSDWNKGTGWTINGGAGNASATFDNLGQTGYSFVINKTYKVTYEVKNYVNGNVRFQLTGGATLNGNTINSNGIYTQYVKATANHTNFRFRGTNFTGSIDNVSVKEVGQNWETNDANITIQDGYARFNNPNIYTRLTNTPTNNIVQGKIYKAKCTVTNYVSGACYFRMPFNNATGVNRIEQNGEYEFISVADNNYSNIVIAAATTNANMNITNISVIEITDDTDLPRIDYTDGTGSLLLEPQSTNLLPYSQTITEFSQTNATLFDNQTISPNGTQDAGGATKLGVNANDRIRETISVSNSTVYNISAFVKNSTIAVGGISTISFRISGGTLFRKGYEWGASGLSFSSAQDSGTRTNEILEDYGNGWYRIGFSFTTDGTSGVFEIDLDRQNGNDTTTLFIWGAQLEQQSFPTSYIPTSGSTVTRNAEVCNNAGSSDLINSTEGVLYAEIAALDNDGTIRRISLSNGGTSNRLEIFYGTIANRIDYNIYSNSSFQASGFSLLSSATDFNKIAVKYKENDFALWVNGTEASTDTSGNTPIGLNKLQLQAASGSNDFYGKVKSVAVFKAALTDAELQCLTS